MINYRLINYRLIYYIYHILLIEQRAIQYVLINPNPTKRGPNGPQEGIYACQSQTSDPNRQSNLEFV